MTSLQTRARRAFSACYQSAIAGAFDATDGDIAEAVDHGLEAVMDLVVKDHTAQVRDWALSRLADLPPEQHRTAYANGEARVLIDLLEHLAGPVPVSRSGVSEEVVPF